MSLNLDAIRHAAPANNPPPPVAGGWPKAGRGLDLARLSITKGIDQAKPPNAPLRAAPLSQLPSARTLPPRGEGIKNPPPLVAWNGQARGPAPTQPFVGAAPRGRPQHSRKERAS
jgi:hypothetical protein